MAIGYNEHIEISQLNVFVIIGVCDNRADFCVKWSFL